MPMNNSKKVPEKHLLQAITTALLRYIAETDPLVLFNGLLETLLELTESEYGFIGEIFYNEDNTPYIKSHAMTNIAWSDETQRLYENTKKKGMVFSRLDSLYGAVLETGQLIISNHPKSDSRSCGVPHGHPPLNSFMGIPFYNEGKLLGVVGIANREDGYHLSLADSLSPFLDTCGILIQAYHNNIQKQQLEKSFEYYKKQLALAEDCVALGFGYVFTYSPPTLLKHASPILLTCKEMELLVHLVKNRNQVIHALKLEELIWKNTIVGESSLRSLVRQLRIKLPELTIKTIRGIGFMLVNT